MAVGALLLSWSSPAGTFTVDDDNYLSTLLALRAGGLSLPGTGSMPASPEWYGFDPFPPLRGAPTVPVMPTAPPFWAPFALPFSLFGLRGLIFLNALCFALSIVLVHRLCALYAKDPRTPNLAAGVFALGSFCIEYAQGIWPHMLSLLLVTFALYAAARARNEERPLGWAVSSGVSAALAAGVRYQNVLIVLALGAGLLFASRRRVRAAALFAIGASGPLLAAAAINFKRLGIFNPVTKGHGYAGIGAAAHPSVGERLADVALSVWTRVVDFSVHPPILESPGGYQWTADPDLGVFVVGGAVKKALLQSSPWVLLGWVLLLVFAARRSAGSPEVRREAIGQALIPAAVLGAFGLAGTGAHDGLCFNARYLIELLPGAAVAVALWFDGRNWNRTPWLIGALAGVVLCAVVGISEPYSILRSELLRFAPLLLSLALVAAFAVARERTSLVAGLLASSVVWAFGVHLLDDLPASHRMRSENAHRLAEVQAVVPDRCALFVTGRARDALWPLTWTSRCLVLDLGKDGGRDAPLLANAMFNDGRRVFVDAEPAPKGVLPWMAEQLGAIVAPVSAGLVELRRGPG